MGKNYFVFWKYDLFPYLLGGEASHIKSKNGKMLYYIPSYERWVNPAYVVSCEEGKKVLDELMVLRENLRIENNNLRRKYDKKLSDILLSIS